MIELLKCAGMLLFFLGAFALVGYIMCKVIKYKAEFVECIFLGFLGYFSLFQCVALWLVLMKKTLNILIVAWGLVFLVILAVFFVFLKRQRTWKESGGIKSVSECVRNGIKNPYLIVCILLMIFMCYFSAIQNQWGWDTAYYIGTVSTTIDTNTMYQYSGETGRQFGEIPFRYALSTFYMNSSVFCKVSGIAPVLFQKYVVGTLCVLLHFIVLYLIGKELFKEESQKKFWFVIIAGMLNFFFVSEYTTSQFLLIRSYEAKAFCGNVIIPAVFWALLRIHKEMEKKENWKILFLVTFASVPVSMSAILIVPLVVLISILADALVSKKRKIIGYGLLCLIPNGIYLIMYFLNTINLFVIKV